MPGTRAKESDMRKATLLGIAAALIVAPTLALSVGNDETSSNSVTEVPSKAESVRCRIRLCLWRREPRATGGRRG